jgi:protein O-GlcNAc transferase
MNRRVRDNRAIFSILSAALAARDRGDRVAASRFVGEARRIDPDHVDVLHVAGIVASEMGRRDEALRLLAKAVGRRPADPQLHRSYGLVAREAGRVDQAIAALRIAMAGNPDDAAVARLLAALLADGGRFQEARAALEAVPTGARDVDLEGDLARLLERAGDIPAANAIFSRLCMVRPRDVRVLTGQGRCLAALGLHADARKLFEAALKLETTPAAGAELAHDYAMLEHSAGNLDSAVAALGSAVMLQPDNPAYRLALARAGSQSSRHVAESTWHYGRLYDANPTPSARQVLDENRLASICVDTDGELAADVHMRAGRVAAETCDAPPPAPFPNPSAVGRRLRIGYVSADFREHAVANFALPLIAAHDRVGFEIHGYGDMPVTDSVTGRFERSFDRWSVIRNLPEDEVARRIRADGIDVLVDLMGLTAHSRLGVFLRRPAPVQVTYLGYPATTGLCCFDARICDAVTDPPGTTEPLFAEPLYRLPRPFLAYRPAIGAPDPAAAPPLLRNGYVTFGSFNNPAKLTRAMISTWRKVLDAVPGSRLVLRNRLNGDPCVADDLRRLFDKAGCPPERLEIAAPVTSSADLMACYDEIDIALDCFPYGGTTTTCEALWMGVPTVTRTGRPHASRVGLSILTSVGLSDLAAETDAGYVAACRRLAGDVGRLVELRRALRGRAENSPLCDAFGLARAMETCFSELWSNWYFITRRAKD